MRVIDTDGNTITGAEIIDISVVDDDHKFGVDELTGEVHWPAELDMLPDDPVN